MRLNLYAAWLLACGITVFCQNVVAVLVATVMMQGAFWLALDWSEDEEDSKC